MKARVGADIGGTFTDVVLDTGGALHSTKVLTNYAAPEQAIFDGLAIVLAEAGLAITDVDVLIHGTTLATNALIERRGARTAFVTSAGFRDVIEMRTEGRFAQYDIDLRLPTPLVPREDRFPIGGRMAANGDELAPLDEAGLDTLGRALAGQGFGAVAIGFLHAYANPLHEQRARSILAAHLDLPISISSEVSPKMREFERFNTVCANAYVRPLMADYLLRLQSRLRQLGGHCPVYLIHSGGGLMSVEAAAQFPVRLVESGPAGGAIFAADIARGFGLDEVVSYDMGGTTAKICLINDFAPRSAQVFEVARTTRFAKGSGMPISIPVIEMIEIGAGGGSIASVDAMGRIQTGPESAGSEPGPASYGRSGERPTITDADLLLGKIDADNFAGGAIRLDLPAAERAVRRDVGDRLNLAPGAAAFGIAEVVDENMANAARVHAVENGKDIAGHVMIAFGGAAPLHAARMCEKLRVRQCLIPRGAGVGSAIGFLKAPFGYEAVASRVTPLRGFDADAVNTLLSDLKARAEGFVREGAEGPTRTELLAFMRYAGQGWEIPVPIADRIYGPADAAELGERFRTQYARFFGRAIDGQSGLDIEIVSWSVKVEDIRPRPEARPLLSTGTPVTPAQFRQVFDPASGRHLASAVFERERLAAGDRVVGPAVIVERETSTIITSSFDAVIQQDGAILIVARELRA